MNASNKQTALKNKISFVVRSIDESNADIRDHRRQEYRKHHSIASEAQTEVFDGGDSLDSNERIKVLQNVSRRMNLPLDNRLFNDLDTVTHPVTGINVDVKQMRHTVRSDISLGAVLQNDLYLSNNDNPKRNSINSIHSKASMSNASSSDLNFAPSDSSQVVYENIKSNKKALDSKAGHNKDENSILRTNSYKKNNSNAFNNSNGRLLTKEQENTTTSINNANGGVPNKPKNGVYDEDSQGEDLEAALLEAKTQAMNGNIGNLGTHDSISLSTKLSLNDGRRQSVLHFLPMKDEFLTKANKKNHSQGKKNENGKDQSGAQRSLSPNYLHNPSKDGVGLWGSDSSSSSSFSSSSSSSEDDNMDRRNQRKKKGNRNDSSSLLNSSSFSKSDSSSNTNDVFHQEAQIISEYIRVNENAASLKKSTMMMRAANGISANSNTSDDTVNIKSISPAIINGSNAQFSNNSHSTLTNAMLNVHNSRASSFAFNNNNSVSTSRHISGAHIASSPNSKQLSNPDTHHSTSADDANINNNSIPYVKMSSDALAEIQNLLYTDNSEALNSRTTDASNLISSNTRNIQNVNKSFSDVLQNDLVHNSMVYMASESAHSAEVAATASKVSLPKRLLNAIGITEESREEVDDILAEAERTDMEKSLGQNVAIQAFLNVMKKPATATSASKRLQKLARQASEKTALEQLGLMGSSNVYASGNQLSFMTEGSSSGEDNSRTNISNVNKGLKKTKNVKDDKTYASNKHIEKLSLLGNDDNSDDSSQSMSVSSSDGGASITEKNDEQSTLFSAQILPSNKINMTQNFVSNNSGLKPDKIIIPDNDEFQQKQLTRHIRTQSGDGTLKSSACSPSNSLRQQSNILLLQNQNHHQLREKDNEFFNQSWLNPLVQIQEEINEEEESRNGHLNSQVDSLSPTNTKNPKVIDGGISMVTDIKIAAIQKSMTSKVEIASHPIHMEHSTFIPSAEDNPPAYPSSPTFTGLVFTPKSHLERKSELVFVSAVKNSPHNIPNEVHLNTENDALKQHAYVVHDRDFESATVKHIVTSDAQVIQRDILHSPVGIFDFSANSGMNHNNNGILRDKLLITDDDDKITSNSINQEHIKTQNNQNIEQKEHINKEEDEEDDTDFFLTTGPRDSSVSSSYFSIGVVDQKKGDKGNRRYSNNSAAIKERIEVIRKAEIAADLADRFKDLEREEENKLQQFNSIQQSPLHIFGVNDHLQAMEQLNVLIDKVIKNYNPANNITVKSSNANFSTPISPPNTSPNVSCALSQNSSIDEKKNISFNSSSIIPSMMTSANISITSIPVIQIFAPIVENEDRDIIHPLELIAADDNIHATAERLIKEQVALKEEILALQKEADNQRKGAMSSNVVIETDAALGVERPKIRKGTCFVPNRFDEEDEEKEDENDFDVNIVSFASKIDKIGEVLKEGESGTTKFSHNNKIKRKATVFVKSISVDDELDEISEIPVKITATTSSNIVVPEKSVGFLPQANAGDRAHGRRLQRKATMFEHSHANVDDGSSVESDDTNSAPSKIQIESGGLGYERPKMRRGTLFTPATKEEEDELCDSEYDDTDEKNSRIDAHMINSREIIQNKTKEEKPAVNFNIGEGSSEPSPRRPKRKNTAFVAPSQLSTIVEDEDDDEDGAAQMRNGGLVSFENNILSNDMPTAFVNKKGIKRRDTAFAHPTIYNSDGENSEDEKERRWRKSNLINEKKSKMNGRDRSLQRIVKNIDNSSNTTLQSNRLNSTLQTIKDGATKSLIDAKLNGVGIIDAFFFSSKISDDAAESSSDVDVDDNFFNFTGDGGCPLILGQSKTSYSIISRKKSIGNDRDLVIKNSNDEIPINILLAPKEVRKLKKMEAINRISKRNPSSNSHSIDGPRSRVDILFNLRNVENQSQKNKSIPSSWNFTSASGIEVVNDKFDTKVAQEPPINIYTTNKPLQSIPLSSSPSVSQNEIKRQLKLNHSLDNTSPFSINLESTNRRSSVLESASAILVERLDSIILENVEQEHEQSEKFKTSHKKHLKNKKKYSSSSSSSLEDFDTPFFSLHKPSFNTSKDTGHEFKFTPQSIDSMRLNLLASCEIFPIGKSSKSSASTLINDNPDKHIIFEWSKSIIDPLSHYYVSQKSSPFEDDFPDENSISENLRDAATEHSGAGISSLPLSPSFNISELNSLNKLGYGNKMYIGSIQDISNNSEKLWNLLRLSGMRMLLVEDHRSSITQYESNQTHLSIDKPIWVVLQKDIYFKCQKNYKPLHNHIEHVDEKRILSKSPNKLKDNFDFLSQNNLLSLTERFECKFLISAESVKSVEFTDCKFFSSSGQKIPRCLTLNLLPIWRKNDSLIDSFNGSEVFVSHEMEKLSEAEDNSKNEDFSIPIRLFERASSRLPNASEDENFSHLCRILKPIVEKCNIPWINIVSLSQKKQRGLIASKDILKQQPAVSPLLNEKNTSYSKAERINGKYVVVEATDMSNGKPIRWNPFQSPRESIDRTYNNNNNKSPLNINPFLRSSPSPRKGNFMMESPDYKIEPTEANVETFSVNGFKPQSKSYTPLSRNNNNTYYYSSTLPPNLIYNFKPNTTSNRLPPSTLLKSYQHVNNGQSPTGYNDRSALLERKMEHFEYSNGLSLRQPPASTPSHLLQQHHQIEDKYNNNSFLASNKSSINHAYVSSNKPNEPDSGLPSICTPILSSVNTSPFASLSPQRDDRRQQKMTLQYPSSPPREPLDKPPRSSYSRQMLEMHRPINNGFIQSIKKSPDHSSYIQPVHQSTTWMRSMQLLSDKENNQNNTGLLLLKSNQQHTNSNIISDPAASFHPLHSIITQPLPVTNTLLSTNSVIPPSQQSSSNSTPVEEKQHITAHVTKNTAAKMNSSETNQGNSDIIYPILVVSPKEMSPSPILQKSHLSPIYLTLNKVNSQSPNYNQNDEVTNSSQNLIWKNPTAIASANIPVGVKGIVEVKRQMKKQK